MSWSISSDYRIAPNFLYKDLLVTNSHLPNIPGVIETEKLLYLANFILQPIRNKWGVLQVTSAFRSVQVNTSKGGSTTSQHVFGEAADFIPTQAHMDEVFKWVVRESGLVFGQAIRETNDGANWIHISLPRVGKKNQEALRYDGSRYSVWPG